MLSLINKNNRIWEKRQLKSLFTFLYPSLPVEGQRSCSNKVSKILRVVLGLVSDSDGCLWTCGWKDRFSCKLVISLSQHMVDLSDTVVHVHQHVSVSERNNFWDGSPSPRNRSRALVRVQSNQCHLGWSLDMICLDQASGETKEEGINKTKEVRERQRDQASKNAGNHVGLDRTSWRRESLSYLSFERMSPLFFFPACQDIDHSASEM